MNLTISTISLTLRKSPNKSFWVFSSFCLFRIFSIYYLYCECTISHASHGKYASTEWIGGRDLGLETKLGLLILLNGFIYQIWGLELGYDMGRHSKPLCLWLASIMCWLRVAIRVCGSSSCRVKPWVFCYLGWPEPNLFSKHVKNF